MDLAGIDAIIFDSDGVLVDSEIIHIAVGRDLLSELGLHYDQDAYVARFVGLSDADIHAELVRDHMAAFGRAFPSDFDDRLKARTLPRIEAELKPLAGVADLVDAFGGLVAVASSTRLERLRRKLELTDLLGLFHPHIYSAEHVANGKPAPDLFLHAADKLGAPPSRCLVIEDSINGVRAGRAAGMTTVGFLGGGHVDDRHGDRLRDAGADYVVASHAELAAMF